MFDDIFNNVKKDKEDSVNYDVRSEFRGLVEPKLDELLQGAEDINIPLIIVGCLSHSEEDTGDGRTHCQAGIIVATHGRTHQEGIWYPDLMKTLMVMLTNPPLVHVIDEMLPILEAMASKRDDVGEVRGEGFTTFEEARDWLTKKLGNNEWQLFGDDEEEEDDEEDE